VFYDPQEPQHAMIDRGEKNYVIPGIVLIFGVFMVAGGLQRLSMTAESLGLARPKPTSIRV
jgi:hypothetical protein